MKKASLLILLFISIGSLYAQEDGWLIDTAWTEQDNFDKFKQQSEKKFQDFRDSINMRFARALEEEWSLFKVDKPQPLPVRPKPTTPPDTVGENKGNNRLPEGDVVPSPQKAPEKPKVLPLPIDTNNMEKTSIMFYNANIALEIPQKDKIKKCILTNTDEQGVSMFWQQMTKNNLQSCINRLLLQQQKLNLNDWAVYEMTLNLAKTMFSDANRQVAATVFLMNQMEYNVKIARTDKGLACLLAIDCTVYSTPYVKIEGKKYYIFLPNNEQRKLDGDIYSYTCNMENAVLPLDMSISKSPLLPVKKTSSNRYVRTVNNSTVEIETNENIIDFYKNYPQVEITFYANAMISHELKDNIDKYFVAMVKGQSTYQAVSVLLNYMQYGFDYATDQEQFGYEKPFFFEENFFYPKNDCEDRAILFSYLVRYILKLDVVLLDYPDHIATAVCFPENFNVTGDYFIHKGKKYYVCDPTYIGASVGMSQPSYINVNAKILELNPIQQ